MTCRFIKKRKMYELPLISVYDVRGVFWSASGSYWNSSRVGPSVYPGSCRWMPVNVCVFLGLGRLAAIFL